MLTVLISFYNLGSIGPYFWLVFIIMRYFLLVSDHSSYNIVLIKKVHISTITLKLSETIKEIQTIF